MNFFCKNVTKTEAEEFPAGSVVRALYSHCRGFGFSPSMVGEQQQKQNKKQRDLSRN